MLTQLIKRLFPSQKTDHSETDAKIAVPEKEVAELKSLLEAQSQSPLIHDEENEKTQEVLVPSQTAVSVQAMESSLASAAYFDMEEVLGDGQGDIVVEVTLYDPAGNPLEKVTFSGAEDCEGPMRSDIWRNAWRKADEYVKPLKDSQIPLRNEKRFGVHKAYCIEKKQIPEYLTIEMAQYEQVENQPLGPFFPENGPVLVHSLGTWAQDVAEAQRRMDLFFSTAEAFKFARQRDAAAECKGSFRTIGDYSYTFWSREYFHSHDGWDTKGESATIIRISPKEFYHPFDPYHAKERVLAMYGEQDTWVWLNGWGETSYEQLWNVPEGLEALEQERYYLGYSKFRAKNFLGMVGYFEVRRSSF